MDLVFVFAVIAGLSLSGSAVFIGIKVAEFITEEEEKEMGHLNELYKCGRCGKYSRRHHQRMAYAQARLNKEADVPWEEKGEGLCPICKKPGHLSRTKDNYYWLKTHPHSFLLDAKSFRRFKEGFKKIEKSIEDMEADEALVAYNGFEYVDLKEEKKEPEKIQPLDSGVMVELRKSKGETYYNVSDSSGISVDLMDAGGMTFFRISNGLHRWEPATPEFWKWVNEHSDEDIIRERVYVKDGYKNSSATRFY